MNKYIVYFVLGALACVGLFFGGYAIGSKDKEIEYVIKEREVIKKEYIYIEEKKRDVEKDVYSTDYHTKLDWLLSNYKRK